jgi:short-subunit dehydrogenase
MAKAAVTALITGASSGLGSEFARQLAAKGADLVLVARDGAALEELSEELERAYGVTSEVLAADLTTTEGLTSVEARLADRGRPVGILVNNAGFGLDLRFERNDIADEDRHLDLHVRATMRLTHAALGPMLARGRGRIVNVASVAAFLPRGTYGAVKAWVVSFSRWANATYRGRGVTVTVVCPGFTHGGSAVPAVARRTRRRARGAPGRRPRPRGLRAVGAVQGAHRARAGAAVRPDRAAGQDGSLSVRLVPPTRADPIAWGA